MEWPHICGCWICRPGRYPRVPDDPHAPYIAAASAYHRPVPGWANPLKLLGPGQPVRADIQVDLFLNGEELDYRRYSAQEILIGEPGWFVYRDYNYQHGSESSTMNFLCPCGSGAACSHVAFGRVQVRVRKPYEPVRRLREITPGLWVPEDGWEESSGEGPATALPEV